MTADVRERAQLAVVAPHHRHGLAGHLGCRERAGIGHDALRADEDPRRARRRRRARPRRCRLHVGAGGQRDALLVGDAHARSSARLPGARARGRARGRSRRAAPAARARQRARTAAPRWPPRPRGAPAHARTCAATSSTQERYDSLDVRPQRRLVQRGAQHLGPDAPVLLHCLLVDEVGEHGGLEPLARRLAAGDGRLDEGVDLLVGVQERAAQELRARVEVVVHEGARDACGARHVAHAHAVAAALGDHTARGTEDIVGAVGDSHLTDSLVKRIRTAVSRRRHPARTTSESFRRLPP